MARRIRPIIHEDRLSIVEHLDELRTRRSSCAASRSASPGRSLLAEPPGPEDREPPAAPRHKPITLGVPPRRSTTTFNCGLRGDAHRAAGDPLPALRVHAAGLHAPASGGWRIPLLLMIPLLFIARRGVRLLRRAAGRPCTSSSTSTPTSSASRSGRATTTASSPQLIACGLVFQIPVGILALQAWAVTPQQAAQGPPLRDRRDRRARRRCCRASTRDADARNGPDDRALRAEYLARVAFGRPPPEALGPRRLG